MKSNKLVITLLVVFISTINTYALRLDVKEDIKQIKQYNKAGVYEISKDNEKITAIAMKKTKIRKNNITIVADDFIFKQNEINKLNDTQIINLANAKAYYQTTNKELPLKVVVKNSNCVYKCDTTQVKVMFVSDSVSSSVYAYKPVKNGVYIKMEDERVVENNPIINAVIQGVTEERLTTERKEEKKELPKNVIQTVDNDDVWSNSEQINKQDISLFEKVIIASSSTIIIAAPLVFIYLQYTLVGRRVKGIISTLLKSSQNT